MKALRLIIAALVCSLYLAAVWCRADVLGVWFSPRGRCQETILKHIDAAKKEVKWQAYNFTSKPTADALIKATKRGVHVAVILDYRASQSRASQAVALAKGGCMVYLDNTHAIAHDKTRIFDGKVVLTGSYNDSDSAETRNGETLIAFDDPEDVAKCVENWGKHLQHSVYLEVK